MAGINKKIIITTVGVIGFMLLAAGCEKSPSEDTDDFGTGKPEVVGYEIVDPCGEGHQRVLNVSGCTLHLENSILADADADSFKVHINTDGYNVDLYEQVFVSVITDSLCHYTFSVDISFPHNGQYTINVFKQVNNRQASFEWSSTINVSECSSSE